MWRTHPLAPWAKAIPGCGEKLIARLVAIVGEPSLRPVGHWALTDNGRQEWVVEGYEERTAGELLAYCGHGDPIEACAAAACRVRSCSSTATRTRRSPRGSSATSSCARPHRRTATAISPSAPATPPRSTIASASAAARAAARRCQARPWSENHKHHAAIRNTTHAFLIELWRESRRVRGLSVTAKRGRRGGSPGPSLNQLDAHGRVA